MHEDDGGVDKEHMEECIGGIRRPEGEAVQKSGWIM